MANSIMVTVACDLTVGPGTAGSAHFNVNDIVPPTSAFYQALLNAGKAVDTGNPFGVATNTAWTTQQISDQRTRQDSDFRAKGIVAPATDVTGVTLTTTADATLTKAYYIDVTALANNGFGIATAGQMSALAVDCGTPLFQNNLFKNGSSPQGYLYGSPSQVAGTNPASPNQNPIAIREYRIRTTAPKVAFSVYRANGAAVDGHQLFVDGFPVTIRPQPGSTTAEYIMVTFQDVRMRDIYLRTSAFLGPIFINPIYDLVKPVTPRGGLVAYTMGDSYPNFCWTDNGSAQGIQTETLASGIEDFLGWGEHYIDCVNGTGWTVRVSSTYQGPNNNFLDRWPQLLRVNPDIVYIPNGAGNDCQNLVDPNTIAANINNALRQYRKINPSGKIIMGDGFTPPLGNLATNGPRYVALRNILIPLLADVGVYYIDTSAWMYGTGKIGATNGSGPSDWAIGSDGAHCVAVGYRWLRRRQSHIVRRIMTDNGALLNTVQS